MKTADVASIMSITKVKSSSLLLLLPWLTKQQRTAVWIKARNIFSRVYAVSLVDGCVLFITVHSPLTRKFVRYIWLRSTQVQVHSAYSHSWGLARTRCPQTIVKQTTHTYSVNISVEIIGSCNEGLMSEGVRKLNSATTYYILLVFFRTAYVTLASGGSYTNEQEKQWGQRLCPLWRGRPYLRGQIKH